MGLIIYLAGIVLTVFAIFDVFKKNISDSWKIAVTIILLFTSWVGWLVYFLYARDKLEKWCR